MLKRIAGIIVALLALAAPALAQTPFVRVSPTVTLAVTTTSGRVAIGTSTRISTLWVCNTGSNDAYIYFGDSTVVALTDGTILRSGVCGNISPDGKTNLAAITAASTTTLVITPGSGFLFGTGGGGSGGGGGGAVTVADGADVAEGTTTDAASCASGTSLLACLRQADADIKAAVPACSAVPCATTIGNVGIVSQYPAGATAITASATGTTGATTATLAGTSGKTTFICGYSIRANATAAATVTNTVTGLITATMSHIMWVAPLASGIGVDEQIFSPCIPASATNTGIAIVSGAPGSGGTVSSTGWGYQL